MIKYDAKLWYAGGLQAREATSNAVPRQALMHIAEGDFLKRGEWEEPTPEEEGLLC